LSLPDTICGYHLAIVRGHITKFKSRYSFRLLCSIAANYQFKISANGVTRFGLPQSALSNAILPCPPLDEQEQIAKFLANSCREQVQQKSAAEGQICSITSSAMVRLFSEQAFKNLARPWGQRRGCSCRRRITTRGGHPNSGIDWPGIMHDLFLSMITYFP